MNFQRAKIVILGDFHNKKSASILTDFSNGLVVSVLFYGLSPVAS